MSRPLPLLRRSLADGARPLLGWSLGIAAALTLYLPLFPSMGGNGQMEEMIANLPPELVKTLGYDTISTGAGYTQGTYFGLIGFLLLTIAATGWGSAAIAGAEESGRLELVLAHGVSRTRYALEQTAAVLLRLLLLGAVGAVLVLAFNQPSGLGLQASHVLAASAALVALTALSATAALAVGALTGRRVLATGAGAAVAVLGYVLNAVANQSPDGEALHALSPYHWAYGQTPLADGLDPAGLGWLLLAIAVCTGIAVLALRRRDVTG